MLVPKPGTAKVYNSLSGRGQAMLLGQDYVRVSHEIVVTHLLFVLKNILLEPDCVFGYEFDSEKNTTFELYSTDLYRVWLS